MKLIYLFCTFKKITLNSLVHLDHNNVIIQQIATYTFGSDNVQACYRLVKIFQSNTGNTKHRLGAIHLPLVSENNVSTIHQKFSKLIENFKSVIQSEKLPLIS